ncbi:hypothetical protein FRC15_003311 [Serendipita sp. 397]|nr:hypothetical protein FRC15_003311 [Serendipita sp. 397]
MLNVKLVIIGASGVGKVRISLAFLRGRRLLVLEDLFTDEGTPAITTVLTTGLMRGSIRVDGFPQTTELP